MIHAWDGIDASQAQKYIKDLDNMLLNVLNVNDFIFVNIWHFSIEKGLLYRKQMIYQPCIVMYNVGVNSKSI